ncbi:MAG: hypothetical protein GTN38_03910 [Candidatus Aenigmarchaeota archaeon]|nr:hypothetical protein [Candidatus Aenigmarchaeota archaeon]NIP40808.1 hypothetical protein [Candidatus Aenigmarchaeota archaeon]NIQ17922.1 hypothetical protein [Candidatus Aenigmarchaeota archaeon]NIS73511.1 hypothetical protein [Candidatus Aenigmarchaeota archaeon]
MKSSIKPALCTAALGLLGLSDCASKFLYEGNKIFAVRGDNEIRFYMDKKEITVLLDSDTEIPKSYVISNNPGGWEPGRGGVEGIIFEDSDLDGDPNRTIVKIRYSAGGSDTFIVKGPLRNDSISNIDFYNPGKNTWEKLDPNAPDIPEKRKTQLIKIFEIEEDDCERILEAYKIKK